MRNVYIVEKVSMDKREFSSIESCLVEHLQRSGQLRQLSIMRLFMHWKDVVGILVAKNTKLVSIEPPLIMVYAYTSAWMQQLQMQKRQILKRINDFYGQELIKDIRVRMYRQSLIKEEKPQQVEGLLDRLQAKEPSYRLVEREKYPLTEAEERAIITSLACITDDDLRQRLYRTRVHQLQKEKQLVSHHYIRCQQCGQWMEPPKLNGPIICSACINKDKRRRITKVKEMLKRRPYWQLNDIRNFMSNCSLDEYSTAKRELIYFYISRIHSGSMNKNDMIRVAMLITGKNGQKLTERFVVNLINKYRLPDEKLPVPKGDVLLQVKENLNN